MQEGHESIFLVIREGSDEGYFAIDVCGDDGAEFNVAMQLSPIIAERM
jgi:hypothetical protein